MCASLRGRALSNVVSLASLNSRTLPSGLFSLISIDSSGGIQFRQLSVFRHVCFRRLAVPSRNKARRGTVGGNRNRSAYIFRVSHCVCFPFPPSPMLGVHGSQRLVRLEVLVNIVEGGIVEGGGGGGNESYYGFYFRLQSPAFVFHMHATFLHSASSLQLFVHLPILFLNDRLTKLFQNNRTTDQ